MIKLTINNTRPWTQVEGQAVKSTPSTILAAQPTDIILDVCGDNAYEELVFALDGGEWWQNDKSEFITKKLVSTDTILFELYKDGVKVADLNDDTYGVFYNGFTNQPLYVGYLIDWLYVYLMLGVGKYQVKTNKTILGTTTVEESRIFNLMTYSDEAADNTVRIESYQTGTIKNNPIDYEGLLPNGWYGSIRIAGKFGNKTPKLTKDNYLDYDDVVQQNILTTVNEWTLSTELLPSYVSDKIVYDYLLANSIQITDYTLLNEDVYRRINVLFDEYQEKKNHNFSKMANFVFKFVDKIQNIKKTNQ